jgi:hypothetical protein
MKIKLRSSVRFLASIFAGTGTAVRKDGLATYVDVDFSGLQRQDDVTSTELASLYVGAWDAITKTFRLYLGSSLKGEQGNTGEQGNPGTPGAPGDEVNFASLAIAEATTISGAPTFLRTAGYSTVGDGGGALYREVGSAPSHLAYFQSADGAYWEYVVDGPLNIKQFGGVGDGTTANDTALSIALSLWAANGFGHIYFPAGKYKFTSKVTHVLIFSLPVLGMTRGFTISGDGQNATKLYWPNADGGLWLEQANSNQSIIVRDLSFVTNQAGGGTALRLLATGGFGPVPAQSSITNLTFQGDDGGGPGSRYWTTSIDVVAWPLINFYNCLFVGAGSIGIGVRLSGTADNYYGILYNFTSCLFNILNTGILYDSFVQGVTVVGCNFNGGIYGIHSPSTAQGILAQLAVTNSQFDNAGHQIFTEAAIGNTQINNCIFFVKEGFAGLQLSASLYPQVTNSWFNGPSVTSAAQGIHVEGPAIAGTITGNIFRSFGIGIVLAAGSAGVNVQSNSYSAVTTHVLNPGTGNTVGGGSD